MNKKSKSQSRSKAQQNQPQPAASIEETKQPAHPNEQDSCSDEEILIRERPECGHFAHMD